MAGTPPKILLTPRFACLALAITLLPVVTGCNWVKLVSVSSSGEQAEVNSVSGDASLSADGRYVAFWSPAGNLVADDIGGHEDIFVHDTLDGITTRVSVDSAGNQANHDSFHPQISANGRYVTFSSLASNLVDGDTNNQHDIFVHDRVTATTTRVSVDSEGNEGNFASMSPSISDDGRYVAFYSYANNLVPGDTFFGSYDIFVHDRDTATTARVSVDSAGNAAKGHSQDPVISGDGRYVAFLSWASNLVAGDTNQRSDIFVHDRSTATTTRVSVDSVGNGGNGHSREAAISSDGRFTVFESEASNLVAGDTNSMHDIFVHDRETAITTRVSVDATGNQANSFSSGKTAISGDGRYVAFTSHASNLVAGDTNARSDAFVYDRVTGTTSRVSEGAVGGELTNNSRSESLSGNGRYVTFSGGPANLSGDINGGYDIFVFTRALPEINVSSVVPEHLPTGVTTSVTVTGSNFLPGATPSLKGALLTNIVIVDESTITMDVAVKTDQSRGARTLVVSLFGTGPGAFTGASARCVDCVTYQ